jgi:hypothetical protein
LDCEGIVSKRLGWALPVGAISALGEGRKPKAPAVRPEAEEDWGRA